MFLSRVGEVRKQSRSTMAVNVEPPAFVIVGGGLRPEWGFADGAVDLGTAIDYTIYYSWSMAAPPRKVAPLHTHRA